MIDNYFTAGNQRFKKVCKKNKCSTNCNSMYYIHTRHRWCYDENYALRSDQNERIRVHGKTSNIMTNIINENDEYHHVYEKNMRMYTEMITDNKYIKALQRVADIYKINCNSLTVSVIKELSK